MKEHCGNQGVDPWAAGKLHNAKGPEINHDEAQNREQHDNPRTEEQRLRQNGSEARRISGQEVGDGERHPGKTHGIKNACNAEPESLDKKTRIQGRLAGGRLGSSDWRRDGTRTGSHGDLWWRNECGRPDRNSGFCGMLSGRQTDPVAAGLVAGFAGDVLTPSAMASCNVAAIRKSVLPKKSSIGTLNVGSFRRSGLG